MPPRTPPPPTERREAYFAGRVQGVGFRYTTREIAERYPVTGFVQNLFDGRVLVVAEGTAESLTSFLGELERRMARNIVSVEATTREARGEFSQFEIRR